MFTTDEAVILAGGRGTRLRSVIGELPKALAPVGGRPFLAWVLNALAQQGLRRVIVATGFCADQVEETLGDTWRGMELAYSREHEPLGTGGAIAVATKILQGDACFVVNGDTHLRLDYAAFAASTAAAGAPLGMALARVEDASRYGAVRVDQGRVTGFVEKGQSGPGYINAGVYWMTKSLMSTTTATGRFSFETDVLMPTAASAHVAAFVATSGFIDIGVPQDYERAQSLFPAPRITP